MVKRLLCLLSVILVVVSADDKPFRDFKSQLNPGCTDPICNQQSPQPGSGNQSMVQLPNILYMRGALSAPSNGISDTLHIVFTTFGGFPSLLFVHCNASSSDLLFDWSKLLNGSSKFGGVKAPSDCANHYSFALVAVSVIDFNDTADGGELNDNIHAMTYVPLAQFPWSRVSGNANDWQAQIDPGAYFAQNGSYFFNNGTFSLRLFVDGITGARPDELPHLQFSGNSVQIDNVLDHWNSQYKNSRIALEYVLVSDLIDVSHDDKEPKSDAKWYSSQSIDDEYTPGTFTLNNWVTHGSLGAVQTAPSNALDVNNGYLQYKPIAYTIEGKYSVENTVSTGYTPPVVTNVLYANVRVLNALKYSIVSAYFAQSTVECGKFGNDTIYCPLNYTASGANVTLGQVGDGFYRKTSWSKWTMQAGFGVPPQDAVSALVIIIILVGLGIPLVLILGGALFMCIRKLRRDQGTYERIN